MEGVSKVVIDEGVITGETEPLLIYKNAEQSVAAGD